MGIFKYFWEGGRINHDIKVLIRQDEEIINFVESRNYRLDIIEIYQLRNLIIQKAIKSEIITDSEAKSKCGNKESLFGYWWIVGSVNQALSVDIVFSDNFYKK